MITGVHLLIRIPSIILRVIQYNAIFLCVIISAIVLFLLFFVIYMWCLGPLSGISNTVHYRLIKFIKTFIMCTYFSLPKTYSDGTEQLCTKPILINSTCCWTKFDQTPVWLKYSTSISLSITNASSHVTGMMRDPLF